jgi:hypothetical protein
MALQIVKVEPSPRQTKRFRAFINNGKYIDFGLKEGKTFIDHGDLDKRMNFISRQYWGRQKELIDNLTLSPALLSMYLLWGYNTDINKNMEYLNKELAKKY